MTFPADRFLVRTMERPELDFALELAGAEGWNPGLHDADSFFRADPEGFLIGLLDGQPIGCISAVSYPTSQHETGGGFGFIGLYIVLPTFRGHGFGMRLWKAAMDRLSRHNVGLDGVLAQQANYIKSGFRFAYRNIRYEAAATTTVGWESPALRDLVEVPLETLAAYDRHCFPAVRKAFLESWRRTPGTRALAWQKAEELLGYGVLRPCRRGYKIGPLFANREDIAERLYQGLCFHAKAGEPVFLDVPEVNSAAVALARRHGMVKVFETARMYTAEPPNVALEHVYGVTTFELG